MSAADNPGLAALERPIFLVSPPRSGSSMLFRTLVQSPTACWIGGESHALFEGIEGFHPAARGWIAAAFPQARFLFLYRSAGPTMASMMEAWETGNFRTYPRLPLWPGLPWSLLLVPGWEDLRGQPLEAIVAHQWERTVASLCADLSTLDPSRVVGADYETIIAQPGRAVPELCQRLDLAWDRPIGAKLPLSRTVVSAPSSEKWRSRAKNRSSGCGPSFTATPVVAAWSPLSLSRKHRARQSRFTLSAGNPAGFAKLRQWLNGVLVWS